MKKKTDDKKIPDTFQNEDNIKVSKMHTKTDEERKIHSIFKEKKDSLAFRNLVW